jgi:hypothetical protein
MYWGCECVCDLFTIGPVLLCVKITQVMTKLEYLRSIVWSKATRLYRDMSKRVHHIEEFDIQKARIQEVSVPQIRLDNILSFDCP